MKAESSEECERQMEEAKKNRPKYQVWRSPHKGAKSNRRF